MGKYIRRRLLHALPTIFIPLVLVFFLLRLAPGDPAVQILGDNATPEQIAALRTQLGLDQPLPLQFLLWLKGLFTLQLGDSLFFHKPVLELIPAYAAEISTASGNLRYIPLERISHHDQLPNLTRSLGLVHPAEIELTQTAEALLRSINTVCFELNLIGKGPRAITNANG